MAKDHAPDFPPDSNEFNGDGTAQWFVDRAKIAPLTDGGVQTAGLLRRALALEPTHHDAQILLERLHQMCVPRWHFPMLADTGRNRAYAAAIAAKVRPGDIVLDIGTGAGLTAMLAARAGAAHVYTCEMQPLIAEAAEKVIADNGLSDRITVLPKASYHLLLGEDLPERADVVVSEIVDCTLLGEGAMATLVHAMQALAKPGARAVPEFGVVKAQLVESERLAELYRPAQAEGFDLGAFHDFAKVAQITPNDLEVCGLRALGPGAELFSFDFAAPSVTGSRRIMDLRADHAGTAHAVLVYFEMALAPGIGLSNALDGGGHWGRMAALLDRPEALSAGDRLGVTASHDGTQICLTPQGVMRPGMSADREMVDGLVV